MNKLKLMKLICFAAVAVILLLSGGCMTYRGFMSDKRILAEAKSFAENLSLETCDYRLSGGFGVIQRYRGWSSAMLVEYPAGRILFDGKKAYLFEDASSFDRATESGDIPQDDPQVYELPDFSFQKYDALAEQLILLLKTGMTQEGLFSIRYNRDHITGSDYLYFDIDRGYVDSDAFAELMGKRYEGGFVMFQYRGEKRSVNLCSFVFWQYAEDGETEIRDYFDFMDPNTNNGYWFF